LHEVETGVTLNCNRWGLMNISLEVGRYGGEV